MLTLLAEASTLSYPDAIALVALLVFCGWCAFLMS